MSTPTSPFRYASGQRGLSTAPDEKILDVGTQESFPATELDIKVVVVGAPGVGKTSLVRRYALDYFSHRTSPTIGLDVVAFPVKGFQQSHPVVVSFWDVSSAELAGQQHSLVFTEADAVILVCDVSDFNSLKGVDEWRSVAAVTSAPGRTTHFALLANKSDTSRAAFLTDSVLDDYAKASKLDFWKPVSAKTGNGVHAAIGKVIRSILLELPDPSFNDDSLDYDLGSNDETPSQTPLFAQSWSDIPTRRTPHVFRKPQEVSLMDVSSHLKRLKTRIRSCYSQLTTELDSTLTTLSTQSSRSTWDAVAQQLFDVQPVSRDLKAVAAALLGQGRTGTSSANTASTPSSSSSSDSKTPNKGASENSGNSLAVLAGAYATAWQEQMDAEHNSFRMRMKELQVQLREDLVTVAASLETTEDDEFEEHSTDQLYNLVHDFEAAWSVWTTRLQRLQALTTLAQHHEVLVR